MLTMLRCDDTLSSEVNMSAWELKSRSRLIHQVVVTSAAAELPSPS